MPATSIFFSLRDTHQPQVRRFISLRDTHQPQVRRFISLRDACQPQSDGIRFAIPARQPINVLEHVAIAIVFVFVSKIFVFIVVANLIFVLDISLKKQLLISLFKNPN